MSGIQSPVLWLSAVLVLGIVLFLWRRPFSADARARRRREKSHWPVTSRKQGPTVRLAVDLDKPKRQRKR